MRNAFGPLLVLLALLSIGGVAGAAPPEPQRHGPVCTPAGCEGVAGGSTAAGAASFAAAALGAGAVARRRNFLRR